MSLTTVDAANAFLPKDKLLVLNANDDSIQLEVERSIKAKLSGTYSPATLASWTVTGKPGDTPTPNIPQMIQDVAAKLVAAHVYAKAFSSEVGGVPEYAQWLYDQAMDVLDSLVMGLTTIPPDELPPDELPDAVGRLTRDMFWPNNDTGGPRFKRTDVF